MRENEVNRVKEITHYVKFRNSQNQVQKEYIKAHNCCEAVKEARNRYEVDAIIGVGRARNEKIGIFGRL